MKRNRPISNKSAPVEEHRFELHPENAKRTDPFQAPADYFDELPQRIMDRLALESQKQHENPQPSPFLRRVWIASAAATAIVVFFMIIRPAQTDINTNLPEANVTISAGSSAEYDQTYADEALLLEENEITDKDVAGIDFEIMGVALSSTDTTSITPEEIIKYLLDENYDTDLLAEL